MRTLKPREIELKGQEIQRSVRQRLTHFDESCWLAIVNRSIHELTILAEEIEGKFHYQPFEEPSDAPAKLHRANEGTNAKDVAVQQLQLKPVHPKAKNKPRLQGVS